VLLELQQVLRGPGSGSGKVIAGFGNHDTDVSAYSACGIDKAMIFIIDKSSRITLPLVGMPGGGSAPHFSGYLGLARHVNVIFPRVRSATFPASRAPLPPPAGAQKGGGGGGGGHRERDDRYVHTLIDFPCADRHVSIIIFYTTQVQTHMYAYSRRQSSDSTKSLDSDKRWMSGADVDGSMAWIPEDYTPGHQRHVVQQQQEQRNRKEQQQKPAARKLSEQDRPSQQQQMYAYSIRHDEQPPAARSMSATLGAGAGAGAGEWDMEAGAGRVQGGWGSNAGRWMESLSINCAAPRVASQGVGGAARGLLKQVPGETAPLPPPPKPPPRKSLSIQRHEDACAQDSEGPLLYSL
jgi:hypothetical protein